MDKRILYGLGALVAGYVGIKMVKAESYSAEELKKDSCCCGATKSNPCACMYQGVMSCSAKAPKCPCYKALEKNAETFEAESPSWPNVQLSGVSKREDANCILCGKNGGVWHSISWAGGDCEKCDGKGFIEKDYFLPTYRKYRCGNRKCYQGKVITEELPAHIECYNEHQIKYGGDEGQRMQYSATFEWFDGEKERWMCKRCGKYHGEIINIDTSINIKRESKALAQRCCAIGGGEEYIKGW